MQPPNKLQRYLPICLHKKNKKRHGTSLLSKMEQSRLEPVALASPLTIPPQGQELLDQVLRESTGKRIQKKSPKPSGNLQPVNTKDSEATGPKWV